MKVNKAKVPNKEKTMEVELMEITIVVPLSSERDNNEKNN